MTGVEVLLVAVAGGVLTLRSPRGRALAGGAVRKSWRYAVPAARRAGQAGAGRVHQLRRWNAERGNTVVLPAVPTASTPAPAAPVRVPSPRPARDTRPPERITRIADGVYVGHQITKAIERIGSHMDEMRAVTRALAAAGEVRPDGLLGLLEAMTGMQTALAGMANMITDIAEHADTEMWVDMRAVTPLYKVASSVSVETQTIRAAMAKLRDLYSEEIAVEEKAAEGGVRRLNPALGQPRAA